LTENVSRNLSRDFINMNLRSTEDLINIDQNDIELKSNLETDNITNRLKSINKTVLKENSIHNNNFGNSQSLSNTNNDNQSHTIKTFNMYSSKNDLTSLNSTLIKSSNMTRSLSKPKRTPKNFNHTLQRINKINDNLTKCNLELTKINSTINDLYFTLNNQDYKGSSQNTKSLGENFITQEKIYKLENKKNKIMKE